MPSWIRKSRELTIPQELMLDVRYLRYCPECEAFTPQETIAEGQDRILRCTACKTEERFVLSHGLLIPEGTLPLLRSFTRLRLREILHGT